MGANAIFIAFHLLSVFSQHRDITMKIIYKDNGNAKYHNDKLKLSKRLYGYTVPVQSTLPVTKPNDVVLDGFKLQNDIF